MPTTPFASSLCGVELGASRQARSKAGKLWQHFSRVLRRQAGWRDMQTLLPCTLNVIKNPCGFGLAAGFQGNLEDELLASAASQQIQEQHKQQNSIVKNPPCCTSAPKLIVCRRWARADRLAAGVRGALQVFLGLATLCPVLRCVGRGLAFPMSAKLFE